VRQAGATEWKGIKISPGMIRAGVARLEELRAADVDLSYAVTEVFWAMTEVEFLQMRGRQNIQDQRCDMYRDG